MKDPVFLLLRVTPLIAAAAIPASADTLHDNGVGVAGINNAFTSDEDANISGGMGRRVADDVIFATPVTITGIEWTGGYFSSNDTGASDAFQISFYQDNSGEPGAHIATVNAGNSVNRTDSGSNFFGGGVNIYSYSHQGFSQSLPAGRVWIAIYNDTGTGGDNWAWAGFLGAAGVGHAVRDDDTSDGFNSFNVLAGGATRVDMDFKVCGTVDGPAMVPKFSSITYSSGFLGITVTDIPVGESFHLRRSSTGTGFSAFNPARNFTSATSFPIFIPVNITNNPNGLIQIFEGPSP